MDWEHDQTGVIVTKASAGEELVSLDFEDEALQFLEKSFRVGEHGIAALRTDHKNEGYQDIQATDSSIRAWRIIQVPMAKP